MTRGKPLTKQQDLMLIRLRRTRRELLRARENYNEAMRSAIEAEIKNTDMARAQGLSEAAIRKWRERHG